MASLPALLLAAAAALPPGPSPTFLRDAAETKNFSLGRPVSVRVTPDGRALLFLRSPPRDPSVALYELDVASGTTRELVTPAAVLHGAEEQLSAAERARRERQRVQTKGFTSFELSEDGRLVLLPLSGKLYAVERASGKVRPVYSGVDAVLDPHFSPDGSRVAYAKNDDVWVADVATGRERPLTKGGTDEVTHGLAEFVAQEEMDRDRGFWWSPDGQTIAFEQADQRGVERFTIADPAHPESTPESFPYPRPGHANVEVRLGLARLRGGPVTWVSWDRRKFPYLARVLWKERAAPLTILVQSRDQKTQQVLAVDPGSGKTRLLLEQTDDAWLELDRELPAWLPDGSGLLYSEETSGGRALRLLPAGGGEARTVVPSSFGFDRVVHLPQTGRELRVLCEPSPVNVQLARVSLDGGEVELLYGEAASGEHDVQFAKDGSVYVDTRVTAEKMPETTVHRADGTLLATLPSVAEAPPFTAKIELVEVHGERTYEAAVVRPRAFDPAKRYPVVLSVYGGPTVNVVRADQRAFLLQQWIADHGVIVVSADNRGTPRRGRGWSRAIKGDFGEIPLDDQVDALKALGSRFHELDLSRVGVFGWSFGGYLSALAVLRRPDVFKVGVAGAPVVDWHDYDTHYTERYLGMPAENPAGYASSSLLTYAPKLERPLLLIHGTGDDNVYFFHSLALADALFKAGRPFEFLPLSGTHMVADPVARERLNERIVDFLLRGLAP